LSLCSSVFNFSAPRLVIGMVAMMGMQKRKAGRKASGDCCLGGALRSADVRRAG
jgi:hypothetical protein